MKFIKYITLSLALTFSATSCSDSFLETELVGKVPAEEALKTAADLKKLLNSAYEVSANGSNGRLQVISELLTDNVYPVGNDDFNAVYTRSTDFFNGTIDQFYTDFFRVVNRANTVMENSGVAGSEAAVITAEAKFLRAYAHFQMVRLFAQPYGYKADNSHPGIPVRDKISFDPTFRSSVKDVYAFIIKDLQDAEAALPETNNRYADKWAAKGLLAQVYFQMNDFVNAGAYSAQIIESGKFKFAADGLASRYSQSVNSEWVFGFLSSGPNTDNRSSVLRDNYRTDTQDPTVRIQKSLYEEVAARPSDKRIAWLEVKNVGEANEYVGLKKFNMDYFNVPMIHLTDMMLIRAESLAAQGLDLTQATTLVNQIRARAGVSALPGGLTGPELAAAVRAERRIELVGEGDRTQQVKRIGAKGETSIARNAPWNCPGMVLQFPNSEIIPGFEKNPEGGCN